MMVLDSPYDCDDAEALERMLALSAYWDRKYGVRMNWEGSTATLDGRTKGVKYKGIVKVGAGRVYAEIDAGFLAEKLGGRKYVEKKVRQYLDPQKTVAELRSSE
ncbi:MAG: polyhydroxyalkanoic acid system family protein [Myxococcota bacterium]